MNRHLIGLKYRRFWPSLVPDLSLQSGRARSPGRPFETNLKPTAFEMLASDSCSSEKFACQDRRLEDG